MKENVLICSILFLNTLTLRGYVHSILLFVVELITIQQHYFQYHYCITCTPIYGSSLVTLLKMCCESHHHHLHLLDGEKIIICRLVTSTKSLACVRKNNHTKTALIFKRATQCAWYLVLDLRHVDIFRV